MDDCGHVFVAVAVAVAVVEWLGISDEGGVQGAAVVGASGTGLKELLDEGRLLLLQLGDAFTLLSYLLCKKPVLVLQSLDGLWGGCGRGLGSGRDGGGLCTGGEGLHSGAGYEVIKAAIDFL